MPNDTVNRVMTTERFDYGSFWRVINPSLALMGLTSVCLAVVAAGYLGVLVTLLMCRRNVKQVYMVYQNPKKMQLIKKMEKALDDAAAQRTENREQSDFIRRQV